MKRHELTDEQWEAIEPILPKRTARTEREPNDPRQILNGILWLLRADAPRVRLTRAFWSMENRLRLLPTLVRRSNQRQRCDYLDEHAYER